MKIFNEEHEMFRQAVRSFVAKEVEPHIEAWEQAGQIPKSIWPRMTRAVRDGDHYVQRTWD